jgi:hypothetical protein
MVSKGFWITFAIGLVLVGAAVWGVLTMQKGAHLVPQGSILKVRTQKLDEKASAMVIDFRLSNNSEYPMVIRQAEVTIQTADGNTVTGMPISASDVKTLFQYHPILGDQYNEVMRLRDRVPPKQSVDRMIAVQFNLSEQDVEARKKVTVRLEDITGPVAELSK